MRLPSVLSLAFLLASIVTVVVLGHLPYLAFGCLRERGQETHGVRIVAKHGSVHVEWIDSRDRMKFVPGSDVGWVSTGGLPSALLEHIPGSIFLTTRLYPPVKGWVAGMAFSYRTVAAFSLWWAVAPACLWALASMLRRSWRRKVPVGFDVMRGGRQETSGDRAVVSP